MRSATRAAAFLSRCWCRKRTKLSSSTLDRNLPLTLGLLVDTSRSQTNVLDAERNASRSFLEQMLVQEKDKAFLIHFDREVELLQDLTSSRDKLQSALDLLKTPSDDRSRSNDPNDDSRSGSRHGHA